MPNIPRALYVPSRSTFHLPDLFGRPPVDYNPRVRQYLFAYGTLQPRLAPPAIAAVVRRLRPAGRGWVGGSLYDLGDYPGATFGGTGSFVHGRIYRVPDQLLWAELDQYEGVADGLFHRVRVTVGLRSGRPLACWAYAYSGPSSDRPPIASGRYVPRHSPSPAAVRRR